MDHIHAWRIQMLAAGDTPKVAESLLDRLISSSHQVIMNGASHRPNKRPKGSTDKPGTPSNG
ncbi:hypothetical protein [Streptomyces sp. 351MFTsu5.1]|uniref:hypothetical protein n=1 Tax=Streptomyces sp. 351MFTsu5.1 TaxID=1172180 RepID=UPI000371B2D7|nr:hypothetical protein [Streptomyces sp. 351MFTsu5.1]